MQNKNANNRGRFNRSGKRPSGNRRRPQGGRRKMPTFDPTQFINKNPIQAKEEVYETKHSFADFNLDARILENLAKMNIETPSPIQDQIIPHILDGKDVIGLAQTGTGKTAAFLLPVIQKTLQNMQRQTVIMAPTRELAIQIDAELRKLTKGMRIFSTTCVGGAPIFPQIRSLSRPNQFIIGTPGRMLDLYNRGKLDLTRATTVILDEADRMLDMGFIKDITELLEGTPENRETLLFSATIDERTKGIVHRFLKNPETVSILKKNVTDSIEQDIVTCAQDKKFETLLSLLQQDDFKKVIIFGEMKHSVEKLAKSLKEKNIKAESIHGNKSHGQRQRSLQNMKHGKANVLVATDVAARGIHIDDISHVINYDMPQTFEDYVHRIGRTGRGDKYGKALTFVPGK